MLTWFNRNIDNISWWVIGWLSYATFISFVKEEYSLAFIDLALICFNYILWKRRHAD